MSRTINEIFETHRRLNDADKSVMIHPGLSNNFIVISPEYHDRLRRALITKMNMIDMGIEEIDPITMFALHMLVDSY